MNKIIDHVDMNINSYSKKVLNELKKPLEVEGGKVFVNRLVHLFGLRSKVELSELIGVSTGSLATWQTRNVVPYELAIRLHLATGVSLEYLLFEELKGNYDVMLYAPTKNTQANFANIKHNLNIFRYSICQPINYYGGAVLIERLVNIFQVSSKKKLGELFGISVGTLSTWHTRKVAPHELLCRIHLATGISMHFLCFGKEWEEIEASETAYQLDHIKPKNPTPTPSMDNFAMQLHSFNIDSGEKLALDEPFSFSYNFLEGLGLKNKNVEVIVNNSNIYFVNTKILNATIGTYLFTIKDSFQIGELRLMPDGKIYLIDRDERYQIDPDTTKIHGKVVSILQSV